MAPIEQRNGVLQMEHPLIAVAAYSDRVFWTRAAIENVKRGLIDCSAPIKPGDAP